MSDHRSPRSILKTQKGTIQWRLPFALQLVPCGVSVYYRCKRARLTSQICIIALFFLVETPRFLIRKHGEEKGEPGLHLMDPQLTCSALKTLAYLRGLPEQHEYVQYEFTSIVEQVQWENAARTSLGTMHTVRRTFGPGNARRLATGCLISESITPCFVTMLTTVIFFQMAGTNAVNYYSPRIFQTFGLSAASSKVSETGIDWKAPG